MTRLELLRVTERETLKFRLLVLLVVSVAVFFQDVQEVPVLGVVVLFSAYLAYSAALRTVLIPRFTSYRLLGLMLSVDAATVLAAIYLIGVSTPVIILIPISVVYFGLYQGYVSSLLMALVVSFGFTTIVYATGRLEEMANIIAIQIPSSFLLALLIGYLAQARFRESEERRAYQQVVQTEAQGRRLLEIAASLGDRAWHGLDPRALSDTAAQIAGTPWSALLRSDEGAGNGLQVRLAGATYSPQASQTLPMEAITSIVDQLRRDYEVEGAASSLFPLEWLPAEGQAPDYVWAHSVSTEPFTVLCVLGLLGEAPWDESTKRALRAFASFAGRVLEVQRRFEQAERRSRDVVGELRSAVESAGRLTEIQARRPLQFGALVIEPQRERVRLGSTIVHLSRTEFDLLYALAVNAGNVFNTETLLRTVWGPDYVPQGKPVDVAIHRLRRKLDTLPGGSRLVRTIRGRGYTFVASEASALSAETSAAGREAR